MTTNLETFEQWRVSTQDEFNAWNDAQPETRKIRIRLPWTVNFPDVKFLGFDKKPYTDKTTGKSGVNIFKRMRYINSQGTESAYKVQSPTVISPRGYCTIKTEKGDFKTILVTYDRGNPDHRRYTDNIDEKISKAAVHEILKTPADFGVQETPIPVVTEEIRGTKEYEMAVYSVTKNLAKILNLPKLAGGFDTKSPLRTVFLTPSFYQELDKDGNPMGGPSEMTVWIKTDPLSPAQEITPEQLYLICDGFLEIKDGKVIKGDKKGFECSPEINFCKLNAGSKPSTKTTCTAITITRFQAAPKSNSQEEKLKYLEANAVADEYSMNMNMENLLMGLKSSCGVTSKGIPSIPNGTYNPMDVNSGSSQLPPNITNNSLMNSLDLKISGSNETQQNQSQVIQQKIGVQIQNIPSINTNEMGSFQIPPPAMPSAIGVQNYVPQQIPGLSLPTGVIPGQFIDTSSNLSVVDRLQAYSNPTGVI